jgi:hypothetical protein
LLGGDCHIGQSFVLRPSRVPEKVGENKKKVNRKYSLKKKRLK